ncbi:hypothetical protein PSEUDO8BK_10558 [Pseudomonas sp. 8BK]|nr:hypothetical protein PSEUDO8BK_10558 [Pseudomonas sp. 8BK]
MCLPAQSPLKMNFSYVSGSKTQVQTCPDPIFKGSTHEAVAKSGCCYPRSWRTRRLYHQPLYR